MARVYQEFYCASSGGGCGGFVTVRLNMALQGVVEIICPKCEHKHQRNIKDGVLTGDGRHSSNVTQEIMPTIAAWSKTAKHPESIRRAEGFQEREAVVIEDDPVARRFLKDRLFEVFGSVK